MFSALLLSHVAGAAIKLADIPADRQILDARHVVPFARAAPLRPIAAGLHRLLQQLPVRGGTRWLADSARWLAIRAARLRAFRHRCHFGIGQRGFDGCGRRRCHVARERDIAAEPVTLLRSPATLLLEPVTLSPQTVSLLGRAHRSKHRRCDVRRLAAAEHDGGDAAQQRGAEQQRPGREIRYYAWYFGWEMVFERRVVVRWTVGSQDDVPGAEAGSVTVGLRSRCSA